MLPSFFPLFRKGNTVISCLIVQWKHSAAFNFPFTLDGEEPPQAKLLPLQIPLRFSDFPLPATHLLLLLSTEIGGHSRGEYSTKHSAKLACCQDFTYSIGAHDTAETDGTNLNCWDTISGRCHICHTWSLTSSFHIPMHLWGEALNESLSCGPGATAWALRACPAIYRAWQCAGRWGILSRWLRIGTFSNKYQLYVSWFF
jgi:hypothetical protein